MQEKNRLMRVAPEDVGIESAAVERFIAQIEESGIEMHSFMLLRRGRVAAEGWWAPYAPELPHMMFSLSKSFTSVACGLAISEGKFRLDDAVLDHFAAEAPKRPSANLAAMRVRDLLCMGAGHAEEPHPASSKNWEKFFLAHPVEHRPGNFFLYNSMATFMVASLIERTTGEKLADYLDSRLFQPLGIEKPVWDENGDGIAAGGWGLHLKTEDIARFGQLILQDGVWQGKRLIPSHWVRLATTWQIDNSPGRADDWAQGYCFQFWRCRHNCFRGDGAFGQFNVVMPDQDAVLAITSGTNELQKILDIAFANLLPAMREALPPDPAAAASLREREAALALAKLPESAGEADAALLDKRWLIPASDDGPTRVKLEKRGDRYVLEIRHERTSTLPVGVGEELCGTMYLPGGARRASDNGKTTTYASLSARKDGGVTVYVRLVETPFRLEIELAPDGKGGAKGRIRMAPQKVGEWLEAQEL